MQLKNKLTKFDKLEASIVKLARQREDKIERFEERINTLAQKLYTKEARRELERVRKANRNLEALINERNITYEEAKKELEFYYKLKRRLENIIRKLEHTDKGRILVEKRKYLEEHKEEYKEYQKELKELLEE